MILTSIRDYVRQRGKASLRDISLHVQCDQDAVRGMLEVWTRKQVIKKACVSTGCATGCNKCDESLTEIYVWNE